MCKQLQDAYFVNKSCAYNRGLKTTKTDFIVNLTEPYKSIIICPIERIVFLSSPFDAHKNTQAQIHPLPEALSVTQVSRTCKARSILYLPVQLIYYRLIERQNISVSRYVPECSS